MSDSAVVRWAASYDVLLFFLTLGRERRLRARLLEPARLQAGEAVLDVGCGTGTLALLAQQQVGSAGKVTGIDASAQMVERADHKARKANLPARFEAGTAEALPFPDGQFDVVLCTVTLHHLRRRSRPAALAEMRRVLKTGGRVMLADFVFGKRKSVAGFLHHHVGIKAGDLVDLAAEAGLRVAESGSLDMWDLKYVVAFRD